MGTRLKIEPRRPYFKHTLRLPRIGDPTDQGIITEFGENGRYIVDNKRQRSFLPDDLLFTGKLDETDLLPVEQWFNPNNKNHILAFSEVLRTHAWPQGFVPSSVKFSAGWDRVLTEVVAICWVDHLCQGIQSSHLK